MALYKVLEQCAYAVDGIGIIHTEVGAEVELDAAESRAAGASVAPIEPEPELGSEQADSEDVAKWLAAEKKHLQSVANKAAR